MEIITPPDCVSVDCQRIVLFHRCVHIHPPPSPITSPLSFSWNAIMSEFRHIWVFLMMMDYTVRSDNVPLPHVLLLTHSLNVDIYIWMYVYVPREIGAVSLIRRDNWTSQSLSFQWWFIVLLAHQNGADFSTGILVIIDTSSDRVIRNLTFESCQSSKHFEKENEQREKKLFKSFFFKKIILKLFVILQTQKTKFSILTVETPLYLWACFNVNPT